MGTSYTQLSVDERIELARLRTDGYTLEAIGLCLNRHASTISRELKRNSKPTKQYAGGYAPVRAHELSERRRRWNARFKLVREPALRTYVGEGLAMGCSPEQISGRLARDNRTRTCAVELQGLSISHESIYRFIYYRSAQKDYWHRLLPRAKSRRGRFKHNRIGPSERIPGRVSINEREAKANTRQTFGHWEGDLMLFSTYGQAVLVAHERTSRVCFYRKQPNKQALNVFHALHQLFMPLPPAARRSITFDNGTEFSLHQRLNQELNMATYFCDKYSPWQKGGVENAIGRARRDIPRKIDLAGLNQSDLDRIAQKHNHTPRKCLNYQTPAEAFLQHLNTLHFNCESTFPLSRE
jgi:transposase, IS30 family